MRVLIAGIVGGIVVFLWSFVAHTVLPTRDMGLKSLPNEDAVLGSMRNAIEEPGVYFFPGMDMTRRQTPEEQKAWTAKYQAGPTGLLVFRPRGGEAMTPKLMTIELLSNVLGALILALVLANVAAGYGVRVVLATLIGLFAWVSISISYWNWYGFSDAFVRAELVDQVGGWLAAGLVVAAILGRRGRRPAAA